LEINGSTFPQSFPRPDRWGSNFIHEADEDGSAVIERLRNTKDVPFLRLDYSARQAVVSRVWQAAWNRSTSAKRRAVGINNRWTIFVVLLILWLLGFSLHVAGGLIHLLLVVAVVVLIINLLGGRRSA
jgi:hypothetical protein